MSETMAVQELLFDAAAQLTETIDFGIDAQSLFSGRTPVRPKESDSTQTSRGSSLVQSSRARLLEPTTSFGEQME